MNDRFLSRSFFRRQRSVHLTLPFLFSAVLFSFFPSLPLALALTFAAMAGGLFCYRQKKDFRPLFLAAAGVLLAYLSLLLSPLFSFLSSYLTTTNFAHTLSLFREKLRLSLASLSYGPFYRAVLLGEGEAMPREWLVLFSRTGTRHLLAVSGLHVTTLLGFFSVLPVLFPGGRGKTRLLIALALSIVLLTGLSPSVLRAVLMTCFFYSGRLFRRKAHPVASLLFAAFLLLFFSPSALRDAGFLLSFSATLGILSFALPTLDFLFSSRVPAVSSPAGRLFLRFGKALLSAFLVNLSATVFSLPVTLAFFGETMLLSPLYNLFLVPLMAPVLVCGLLFLFFALFSSAAPFAAAADLFASLLFRLERIFAAAPAFLSLSRPASLAAAGAVAFFLILFFLFLPRVRSLPFLLLIPFLLVFLSHLFFDVV